MKRRLFYKPKRFKMRKSDNKIMVIILAVFACLIVLAIIAAAMISVFLPDTKANGSSVLSASDVSQPQTMTESSSSEPQIPTSSASSVSIPPETTSEDSTSAFRPDVSGVASEGEKVSFDYFNDAVFIGDSRTQGLISYTQLSENNSLAEKGLMVNTVFTKQVIKDDSGGRITVMEALKRRPFRKVYIMLGVNELGWQSSSIFIRDYEKIIDEIWKINPNAIIYVQSIIPVTQKRSSTDEIYNNKKIKQYNELLYKMVLRKKALFVNVQEAVTDSNGNLITEASTDGIHLNKRYCEIWLEYLQTHAVK